MLTVLFWAIVLALLAFVVWQFWPTETPVGTGESLNAPDAPTYHDTDKTLIEVLGSNESKPSNGGSVKVDVFLPNTSDTTPKSVDKPGTLGVMKAPDFVGAGGGGSPGVIQKNVKKAKRPAPNKGKKWDAKKGKYV